MSEDTTNRADRAAARIANIGVPKQELAQRAGIDRGTLGRALKSDPRIADRTWVRIERALSDLEDELGISARLAVQPSTTATGESVVESVVEYHGARITLSGKADAVADAIRRVLSEGDNQAR